MSYGDDTTLKTNLAAELAELQKAVEQHPQSPTVFKLAAYVMGADLCLTVLKSKAAPNELLGQISNFFKFCSSELHLPKKDLPKPIVDRLDRAAKELKEPCQTISGSSCQKTNSHVMF